MSEIGVIGQMYENRANHKLGVLESRDEKYKTLLMRDKDGVSFNITFSTFRSNWRKYEGEELILTSEQSAEIKLEKENELTDAKREMSKSTETTIKFDKQERIEAINAVRVVVANAIADFKYPLELVALTRGGTVVKCKGKRRTLFEIWLPLRYPDVYSFRMREDLDKFVELDEEREYLEKDINCIRYRPKRERFNEVLSIVLNAVEQFLDSQNVVDEKNEVIESDDELEEVE